MLCYSHSSLRVFPSDTFPLFRFLHLRSVAFISHTLPLLFCQTALLISSPRFDAKLPFPPRISCVLLLLCFITRLPNFVAIYFFALLIVSFSCLSPHSLFTLLTASLAHFKHLFLSFYCSFSFYTPYPRAFDALTARPLIYFFHSSELLRPLSSLLIPPRIFWCLQHYVLFLPCLHFLKRQPFSLLSENNIHTIEFTRTLKRPPREFRGGRFLFTYQSPNDTSFFLKNSS